MSRIKRAQAYDAARKLRVLSRVVDGTMQKSAAYDPAEHYYLAPGLMSGFGGLIAGLGGSSLGALGGAALGALIDKARDEDGRFGDRMGVGVGAGLGSMLGGIGGVALGGSLPYHLMGR